jgi:hypothetical protein
MIKSWKCQQERLGIAVTPDSCELSVELALTLIVMKGTHTPSWQKRHTAVMNLWLVACGIFLKGSTGNITRCRDSSCVLPQ